MTTSSAPQPDFVFLFSHFISQRIETGRVGVGGCGILSTEELLSKKCRLSTFCMIDEEQWD